MFKHNKLDTVTSTFLSRNTSSILDDVQREDIVIERCGKPVAVIISAEKYVEYLKSKGEI